MAVIGIEVARREIILGGAAFGEAGAYEKIEGVLRFAVDPARPVHAAIADIDRAPRNARGLVESWADFYVLRPVSGGNHRLLLDVPNRGRKVALGMLNSAPRSNDPASPGDFGNGFLMRHGYTVAWVGWQHDVPRQDRLMALAVPRVTGVSGRMRCEFRPNARVETLPLADRYHIAQPVAALDDPEAELTVREDVAAAAVTIPRKAWSFGCSVGGRLAPDSSCVSLDGGFDPGKIYTCYYRAVDPPVIGLGFAAVRDTAGFLRFASSAQGNPCAEGLDHAFVIGVSQSGRFLRHLLYLGLDEDEAGRSVFDGIIVHVAGARRGEFNCRFGQPSLNALQSVGGLFPFTDLEQEDLLTGQRGALLGRVLARGRAPKIFTINSSAEYWQGGASLVHTDLGGERDVAPPDNVRIYLLAGTQHTPGALPPPPADPNTGGRGRHVFNVVDYSPLLRAALVNLDRWASEGLTPPASAVPRVTERTAVAAERTRTTLSAIPGIRFPDHVRGPARMDFGSHVDLGIVSELPPKLGAPYVTLVSALDDNGNEIAGIRPWELEVPLATFTGWNPRHPEQGAPGDLMAMMGSTIPFALARRPDDPRRSIRERYAGLGDYLGRVRRAAEALVAVRHLLAEDIDEVLERARLLWDFIQERAASGRESS